MAKAQSLADQALKAANGDPIGALNAAATVVEMQKPKLVERMRASHRAKQAGKGTAPDKIPAG